MYIALGFIRTNALCLSSLSPPRSPFRPREERPRAAELRPTADGWPGAGPVPCVPTPRHAAPACPALSPLSRFPFLGPRFRTADFLFFIASVCRCTPFRTFQLSLELTVGGSFPLVVSLGASPREAPARHGARPSEESIGQWQRPTPIPTGRGECPSRKGLWKAKWGKGLQVHVPPLLFRGAGFSGLSRMGSRRFASSCFQVISLHRPGDRCQHLQGC